MTRKELLLLQVMEECDEVSQRVSKALRFGLEEVQPEQELTNAERIIYEFSDLYAVIDMLYREGLLPQVVDPRAIAAKKDKVEKMLQLSKQCNVITDSGDVFKFINPALHLLHNNKPVFPQSKEHQLLVDLHRKCD